MKVRYSLEAFALAFVLYTAGLETALVAAAVIVAGTVIGDTVAGLAGKAAGAVAGCVVTAAGLIGGLKVAGLAADYVPAILTAVLVGKHCYDGVEEASAGEIAKQNYVALIVMAVVAVVRELLGSGHVFGYEVASWGVISANYQDVCFGLIFGGIGIAAVNTILKKEGPVESLWVAVPVVASVVVTAAMSDPAAVLKPAVSAVIAIVLLVSVRGKMIFSEPGKHFAGLPVEMLSLGFLTMMMAVIG